LGCGAHLDELRRTASSEFGIAQARTIEQLESLAAAERLFEALIPASRLLPGMPEVYVNEPAVAGIRSGRNFPAPAFRSLAAARHVKAVTDSGELIAVGEAVLPNLYHPVVVL
jgi:tRNA U55 pseudouridine synthase TruB